jgi:hypothetical protein
MTIENAKLRRAKFASEVQKEMRATGSDYDTCFQLVASRQEFATEFTNDLDADDLVGATKRRDEIQSKVRAMMRDLGISYDSAFAKVLKDNPNLQGHASVMMAQGGFIRFNFATGESLTASRTDYAQAAGFRTNVPKVNLGSQPVGNWGDKSGGRPYLQTRVAA